MSGDILDLIDNALEDWSASEDAMRWSADPKYVICDEGRALWPEVWNVWRHGTWRYTVTAIPAPEAVLTIGSCDDIRHVSIGPGWVVIGPELVREELADAFGFWWSGTLHYHPADAPRSVTRRCPVCSPGPRPLSIDGREYARRRAARKKRR